MPNYQDDISLTLAVSAYNGTSFSPERRGASTRDDYAAELAQALSLFESEAAKGGTSELVAEEFARYRANYAKRLRAYLASSSRCVSSFVAGPSNFPVRRMNKRADIAHRRLGELIEFSKAARAAVIRTLRPDLAPIRTGDSDARERIEAELVGLRAQQDHMKAVNAAHGRFVRNPASLEAAPFDEATKRTIREYKPAYSWEPHPFAPFELTNNGANIRRLERRLKDVAALKEQAAGGDTEETIGVCRVVQCFADNRLRVYFPGKPSHDVRTNLKRHGFKWSPMAGAWQRFISADALYYARTICKEIKS